MNRYYNSGLGRFMTPDPYRSTAGSVNNPADPGSWNRYAYVGGDPVNLYDPEGLFTLAPPDVLTQVLLGLSYFYSPQQPKRPVPLDPPKPAICSSKILRPEFLSIFSKMGDDLDIDPVFIMALAVQESGWNLSHVFETNPSSGGQPLNNLFGLTAGGGNNLPFSSVQASAKYWEKQWGPYLSDNPQTIQDFVSALTCTPGHMYNVNPDWKINIAGGKLSTGKKTIGTYQSVKNALENCDITLP